MYRAINKSALDLRTGALEDRTPASYVTKKNRTRNKKVTPRVQGDKNPDASILKQVYSASYPKIINPGWAGISCFPLNANIIV